MAGCLVANPRAPPEQLAVAAGRTILPLHGPHTSIRSRRGMPIVESRASVAISGQGGHGERILPIRPDSWGLAVSETTAKRAACDRLATRWGGGRCLSESRERASGGLSGICTPGQ